MKNKKWVGLITTVAIIGITMVVILVNSIFASGCTYHVASAADLSDLYVIQFNPAGTHVDDGQLKVRFDFYPTEKAATYESQHLYVPTESYPGKVDKNGDPIDLIDYQLWLDNVSYEWVTYPALIVYIKVAESTTKEQLLDFITLKYDSNVLATIDSALIQTDSLHLIDPYSKDKTTLSTETSTSPSAIADAISKFSNTVITGEAGGTAYPLAPGSISVGANATDRADKLSAGYTVVEQSGPSNADGTITSVEMWLTVAATDIELGTFSASGNDLTTDDSEASLGPVTAGSKQTVIGLTIDILTGEYIGMYDTTARIDTENVGSGGNWYKAGDNIPCTGTTFTSLANYRMSLHGIGTEGGGVSAPTIVTANATSVEETTATLNGNITATGGENAMVRGFNYTGGSVNETGDFGTGNFSLPVTGLSPGTSIEFYAWATNTGGTGTGANVTLTTKPEAPTSLTVASQDNDEIELTWSKGTGAEITEIRYDTSAYPADNTSGTLGYWGTLETVNLTSLSAGQVYYIRAWAFNTDNITLISDGYAQVTDYTLPGNPSGLVLSGPDCESMTANWTAGAGADKSMVRWKEGSYPADETDGTQGYFDTSNGTSITGLPDNAAIYVAVFGYDTDSGYYSAGSSQATENTTASANPAVTTDNATNITHAAARLNVTLASLTCDDADAIFYQWGLSTGNYTANYTASGSFANGSYYYDIGSLSANTTYYVNIKAKISGGAYQDGGETNFTTTATPLLPPDAPLTLTLTDWGGITITATWPTSNNATSYLLLVNRDDYPSSASPTVYETAYSGNLTTANLSGFNVDNQIFYFSVFAGNDYGYSGPTSADIGTGITLSGYISEDDMETLALTINQIFELMIAGTFIIVALWQKDMILYVISAIVTIIIAPLWIADYPGIGFILFGLAVYLFIKAILIMGVESGGSRGFSQFRDFYQRIKGVISK